MNQLTFERHIKKKAVLWYMENVNINLSFKSLEKIAINLGASPQNGDILIVDNERKTKRKIFKKINKNRYAILYLAVGDNDKFIKLSDNPKIDLEGNMLNQGIFY